MATKKIKGHFGKSVTATRASRYTKGGAKATGKFATRNVKRGAAVKAVKAARKGGRGGVARGH